MEAGYYLRTDTKNEAIRSLEKTHETLLLVKRDPYQWKWAIISLHNCVQNSMILALRGSNDACIIKYSKKKWPNDFEDYIYNHPSDKNAELDFFRKLYEKIKSEIHMHKYTDSKVFEPKNHDNSIICFNDLRNNFIHFKSGGWSIDVRNLPLLFEEIIEVVEFSVFESGNCLYQFDDAELA